MEYVTMVWAWVVANWDTVAEVGALVYGLLTLYVAATDSPRDDEALAGVRRLLARFAFLAPRDVPGTLSLPGVAEGSDSDRAEPDDE